MNKTLIVSKDFYFVRGVKGILGSNDESGHSLNIVTNLNMLEAVTSCPDAHYKAIIIDYPSLDIRMSRSLHHFTHVYYNTSIILISGSHKGFMLDISPAVKDFSYASRKCLIPSLVRLIRNVYLVDRDSRHLKKCSRRLTSTARYIKSIDLTIIMLLAKGSSYKEIAIELEVSNKFLYQRMSLIRMLLDFKSKNDFLQFVSGFKNC